MSMAISRKGTGTFKRGVHPPEGKIYAEDVPIEVFPTPASLLIPLHQHTGAPCEATVKPRQEVTMGEKIGEAQAFVSAPVHSPVNGTTQMPSVATLPNGRHVKAIPIKSGEENLQGDALMEEIYGGDWPTDVSDQAPGDITDAVREAGIVGLGGAAFPTAVKFSVPKGKKIDTILVNGCECEPYLTADYRVMVEAPKPIVTGALLAARAVGAENVVIAIEDNKPAAIEEMKQAAAGTDITIAVMKTKYPMGGEKQTILASLGREVPTGGLPLDVGVVVVNVGTCTAVARAVLRGKPLTHRVITISGGGIANPKNLLVPVGTSLQELIDYCGGLEESAARVVAGGPMMGFAVGDLEKTPVTKGTSGLTVLTHQEVKRAEETTCVRCGRCVDVCPVGLVPTKIAHAARYRDWDLTKKYHMMACIECGCCAYACPASIPLVQLIRVGKAQAPRD
ncbi:MAG: electron transport complex subunit RsxC [Phycisphaerae bacterium]